MKDHRYHIQLTHSVLVPSNYVSTVIKPLSLKAAPKVNENGVWGEVTGATEIGNERNPKFCCIFQCL